MGQRHDEIPVLPGEAASLKTHVEQCTRRYNALLRLHYEISKSMRAQRWEGWVYRTLSCALLAAVVWYVRKVADHLPVFVP